MPYISINFIIKMKSIIRSQTTQYKFSYNLGQGQQGDVYCAKNTQNGEHYAIKILNLHQNMSKEIIEKEVNIHKRMSHPNVIKYI
jgi:serine/threonine protein kinase